jgi:hypothetical protein
MAIQPHPYIRSNITETSTIVVNNDDSKPTYTITLDPENNPWLRSSPAKQINLNNPEDCYYLLFKAIINNVSSEKAEEYKTLLKINQGDFKTTVLQIELGEENGH